MIKTIILFLLTSSLLPCNGQNDIPKEMKFSFEFLNEILDSKKIEFFKNTSENEIIENFHFGLGTYLRNNLLRHHEKSENLMLFFDSLGIRHIDNMSSIILTSYHRYLNKENIKLQTQVNKHVEYWKPIIECKKNQEVQAVEIYNRFQIGDTINIKMPVDKDNKAIDYPCSRINLEWDFDESKDLSVKGIITDKYNINSETNVFFKVKVLSKNHSDTRIMVEKVDIGDEFYFSLSTAWKIK